MKFGGDHHSRKFVNDPQREEKSTKRGYAGSKRLTVNKLCLREIGGGGDFKALKGTFLQNLRMMHSEVKLRGEIPIYGSVWETISSC